MRSHTKNLKIFNFRSLSPVNSLASENPNSDKNSVLSDHFHTSSGKIVQPPREWWKNDLSKDIQMEGFQRLSEVDPSVAEPKSDDEITVFSRLDKLEFVEDMVEKEEPKGYWEAGNSPNRQLWKEAVDMELDSLDKAGIWDVVDKVKGEKDVGSK
jgi:hypothetical protein